MDLLLLVGGLRFFIVLRTIEHGIFFQIKITKNLVDQCDSLLLFYG